MEHEQLEGFVGHLAGQLDDLLIEVAALGTVVRALMDTHPDKEALRARINQVLGGSAAKAMSPDAMAALDARHEALLKRLESKDS